MKCHVPRSNVKVFGRTIHALARIADELYLESLPDCIQLLSLNAAESAYAKVIFNKNFFSYFNYNYYSTEDNEGLKCKISMKSALNAFKSPAHIEKQVENLEIKLDPEACTLIFQLKCKSGVVKTHFVSILDSMAVKTVSTKDLVPNRITSSQRILSDALNNLQNSDDQVTLVATAQSLLLRNYIDSMVDLTKVIRTQISLKPAEFYSYIIEEETTITFTQKEFRALLTLAEALNLPIQLNFETTGKQAVFIVHNGSTFNAQFVLSTLMPDIATQSTQDTSHTERYKRKETTDQESARKKQRLESNSLDVAQDNSFVQNNNNSDKENFNGSQNICIENNVAIDCDIIPASPTSRNLIKHVFKRCFECTFDPTNMMGILLAENSDSE